MLKKSLRRSVIDEPVVNLTPLIDVVFVILIMFILIAPLLELDRIELADAKNLKENSNLSIQEASPLALHVRVDNRVTFFGKVVTLEELPDLLRRAKKEYPEATLQLFHDKKAHFGTYQSIKNAAEEAGYQKIDVVLKPS